MKKKNKPSNQQNKENKAKESVEKIEKNGVADKKESTELIKTSTEVDSSEKNKTWKLTKIDYIFILVISLIYAIVSFINLGGNKNPQTFWEANTYWVTDEAGEFVKDEKGEYIQNVDSIVFKIAKGSTDVTKMRYYTGANFGKYSIQYSFDNVYYTEKYEFNTEKVFAWEDYGININFEYMKITSEEQRIYLGEIALYEKIDNQDVQLELIPISGQAELVLDEQDVVPEEISYMNSTYFDEVYFARTAYEHLHNLPIYEWTHPPLGKLIMTVPMLIWGMTPFAYRLMGNIAGILMISAIYILAKMLFKQTKYGVLAAVIMAVDGMHFVQTRLGTADGFLVLFIILEYLFMYRYILQKDASFKKRMILLFFSGFFMGCAIATKWSGVFAAGGLAIVFFIDFLKQFYVEKKKWTPENTLTVLMCFWFFVVVPIIIYVLSYIPFYIVRNAEINDINTFFAMQLKMYNYHHNLVATHPYSSMWYSWPVDTQSVLYWVGTVKGGAITRIALLGNPIIFISGAFCFIATWFYAIKKSCKTEKFLKIMLSVSIISGIGIISSIMPQVYKDVLKPDFADISSNLSYMRNDENLTQDELYKISESSSKISDCIDILEQDGQVTRQNVGTLNANVSLVIQNIEDIRQNQNLNERSINYLDKIEKLVNKDLGKLSSIKLSLFKIMWELSIPFIIFTLGTAVFLAIRSKNYNSWFLIFPVIIMISAYVGVPRIMFIYHYFPVLPFIMLSIVGVSKWICEKTKNDYVLYIFIPIIIIVFVMFYPVYSGFPTSYSYLKDLRWFRTWIW